MKKLTPDDILVKCLEGFRINEELDDCGAVRKIVEFLIEFNLIKDVDGIFSITSIGRELLNLPTD
jgi:hypothetical protein